MNTASKNIAELEGPEWLPSGKTRRRGNHCSTNLKTWNRRAFRGGSQGRNQRIAKTFKDFMEAEGFSSPKGPLCSCALASVQHMVVSHVNLCPLPVFQGLSFPSKSIHGFVSQSYKAFEPFAQLESDCQSQRTFVLEDLAAVLNHTSFWAIKMCSLDILWRELATLATPIWVSLSLWSMIAHGYFFRMYHLVNSYMDIENHLIWRLCSY